jgi:adenylosuccinate synthase
MIKNLYGVIGANYGDEGKGRTVDALCQLHNDKMIVVCTNGSSQRGHTVINKGIRHVFHHFGSGTMAGADTYFSKDFILNPCMFEEEKELLNKKKIAIPCCYANENCRVAFIYDMMVNQIVELSRANKHGSCGCGVWETIQRYSLMNSLNIKELTALSTDKLTDYLKKCRSFSKKRLSQILKEENLTQNIYLEYEPLFNSEELLNAMIYSLNLFLNTVILVPDSSFLNSYDTVIFENGQGLLLDYRLSETLSTPSITGAETIMSVIDDNFPLVDVPLQLYYVSRTYITRHGSADFKEKCNKEEINATMMDETNQPNPFQGSLMFGKLNRYELYDRVKKDTETVKIPFKYGLCITHTSDYPWQDRDKPIGNLWLKLD